MEDDQGAVSRKWYFQILHWALTGRDDRFKATSKNVIPAKAGIQNPLISLDSGLRGSDKLIIIRGSLKICD